MLVFISYLFTRAYMQVNEEWTKRKFIEMNRVYLGLSQKKLAELSGTSALSISHQGRGHRPPRATTIEALRKAGDTLEPLAFWSE
jgi:transcriptional regulator with XRE-family HTH domain